MYGAVRKSCQKNFKMLKLAKKYIGLDVSATAVAFFSKR